MSDWPCRRCHRGAGHVSSRTIDTFCPTFLTLGQLGSCGRACRQYVRLRSRCALAVLVALQEMTFLCMYLICRLAALPLIILHLRGIVRTVPNISTTSALSSPHASSL